jgi:protein dithiol:quinone oxidoreductase
MLKALNKIANSKSYWVSVMILSLGLELVALFYQYALDEWPCVLCIHVRIWLVALIIVSVSAIVSKPNSAKLILMHGAVVAIMLALLERSWILLGVERGTIFGSCDMDLGLPVWFALDKWLPLIFEVKTACGYTPVLFAGITMAEALMVFSSIMLTISLAMVIVVIKKYRDKT